MYGGALFARGYGTLTIRNSTITGNLGGDAAIEAEQLRRGSGQQHRGRQHKLGGYDIDGTITSSNGHNIFGSDVAGQLPGRPREYRRRLPSSPRSIPIPAAASSTPPASSRSRNSLANPALSGADPLAASPPASSAPPHGRSPPAACPTSARSSSTRRSRPRPRPTTTCSPDSSAGQHHQRRWPATTMSKAWAATTP